MGRGNVSACRRVGVSACRRVGVSAWPRVWRGRVALPRDRRGTSIEREQAQKRRALRINLNSEIQVSSFVLVKVPSLG